MQERRKQSRKNLMAYSQVYDLYGGALLGYLGDLTLSGAMVIGEKIIEIDTEITLQFEIPELENIQLKKLTLPSRVVWCQPDVSPEYQNIGFEFKDITDEQSKVIAAIIETYEFRHEMPKYPFRSTTKR
jgi:Tfp pilus assembly protein PilZ